MNKIKTYLNGINPKLWPLFRFYVAVVIVWIMLFFVGSPSYLPTRVQDMLLSIYQSVAGNLVFFGIFGAFTLIPTFSRPRDEPIDRRLSFLITSSHVSEKAMNSIRSEVVRLCGYVESSSVELIMKDWNEHIGAMKLEYRTNSVARNTFESENYADDSFKLVVHPDKVSDDGVYGEIMLAEFAYGSDIETITKTPRKIVDVGKLEIKATLKISRDSTTTYRHHNWIWYSPVEPYYNHASRFTENLSIMIINQTNKIVRIRNYAEDGVEMDLLPNDSKQLFHGPASAGTMNVFQIIQVGEVQVGEVTIGA